ncbi:hypothetical protein [Psychrobacter sp. R86515]|uniref:hypothetical protein n=1 Tax=Psychrobacter sp. R86515 TaxID=3093855 RepID=UPI0036D40317
MCKSICTALNFQIINDAQAISISFSLLNLDNLSLPMQSLAKARYYLSVIHDEVLHAARDNILDRSKVGQFTANLQAELEQAHLEFLGYDNEIKELAELLPQMAKQLYDSFYAHNDLIFSQFHNLTKQMHSIHEHLEKVCLLALYRQVEGK